MFDFNDNTETPFADSQSFGDCDIPEPVEHWSLEDFADVLPAAF